jgi:hypothetical protein
MDCYKWKVIAGWSSQVARRAHNPKVGGSNPSPATNDFRGVSQLGLIPFFCGVEAVGKRPSAALPSSLVTAAYFCVRLIPRDFGSLAYGHFPSASKKPVFRHSLSHRENQFTEICQNAPSSPSSAVVCYGERAQWPVGP